MKYSINILSILLFLLFTHHTIAMDLGEEIEEEPRVFSIPDVAPDKTGIHVIRKSKFTGGGLKIWIANNDKVLTRLPNGTDSYFEIDAGRNTINIVQSRIGFGYIAVDNKPGEVVFIVIDLFPKDGIYTKIIDSDTAKSFIEKSNLVPPLKEARRNDGLTHIIPNPGLLNYPIMKALNTEVASDSNYATVKFYRTETVPSKNEEESNAKSIFEGWAYDIWNQDGYIGSSKGGEYLVAKVKPGQHNFTVASGNLFNLSGNFEAGKEYAIEIVAKPGFVRPKASLKAINISKESKYAEVKRWESHLQAMTLDEKHIKDPVISTRIDDGYKFLSTAVEKGVYKKVVNKELSQEYGR